MLAKYEECSYRGSNWTLHKINDFELHISKYSPLRASSFVPLPDEIKRKKAVINVQNFNDEYCFKYAILSKVMYEKRPRIPHLDQTSRYKKKKNMKICLILIMLNFQLLFMI